MAAYIGAIALVMGYLVTTSVVGQKIEYRDTFARWEPLGTAALEGGDPLLDAERDEQPARRPFGHRCCSTASGPSSSAFIFLGLAIWRFSMTERAPSRRRGCGSSRNAKQRKRQARSGCASSWAAKPIIGAGLTPSALGAVPDAAAGRNPPGPDQPRPDRPGLLAIGLYRATCASAIDLWDPRSSDACRNRHSGRSGSAIFLLMIAAFYGGELVWRERDRKINELIEFDGGAELGR